MEKALDELRVQQIITQIVCYGQIYFALATNFIEPPKNYFTLSKLHV